MTVGALLGTPLTVAPVPALGQQEAAAAVRTDVVQPAAYEGQGVRVLDTRDSSGGPLSAGVPTAISLVGTKAKPGDVVAVNITVVAPEGPGWLAVYNGRYRGTSTLNYRGGDTVAGASYVTVDANRHIRILSLATTDVLVDVLSIIDNQHIRAVTPFRAADSRDGGNVPHFSPREPMRVDVVGREGFPRDAKAAIVNIVAVGGRSPGWVEIDGAPNNPGATSVLNYDGPEPIANNAVIGLGDDGGFSLTTLNPAHLVVDVVGYVPADSAVIPRSPVRVLDTREPLPDWAIDDADRRRSTPDGPRPYEGTLSLRPGGDVYRRLGEFSNRAVRFSGSDIAADLGLPLEPLDAVIVNITMTNTRAAGFSSVWQGPTFPVSSNAAVQYSLLDIGSSLVNYRPGQTVANGVLVAVDELSTLNIFTFTGADVVVDVTGYVKRTPRTVTRRITDFDTAYALRTIERLAVAPGAPVTMNAPERVAGALTSVPFAVRRPVCARDDGRFTGSAVVPGVSGSAADDAFEISWAPGDVLNEVPVITPRPGTDGDFTCVVNISPNRDGVRQFIVDLRVEKAGSTGGARFADSPLGTERGVVDSLPSIGPGDRMVLQDLPYPVSTGELLVAQGRCSDERFTWWPVAARCKSTVGEPDGRSTWQVEAIDAGAAVMLTLSPDTAKYADALNANSFDQSFFIRMPASDGGAVTWHGRGA